MHKDSFCEIWTFWNLFSRAPKTNKFSLVLLKITNYIYSLVQDFCLLKIKITQSPNGFRHKLYGHAPGYLIDLIAIKEQLRYNLRSVSGHILKYPYQFKSEKDFTGLCFFICCP